jgi:hypothetical protein
MFELSYQYTIFLFLSFSVIRFPPSTYMSLCIEEEQSERMLTKKQICYVHLRDCFSSSSSSTIDVEKRRAYIHLYSREKSSLPIERKIWNKNILPQHTLVYINVHRYLFLMYYQQKWHKESEREEKCIVDD